ncbi:hypothetical protein [Tessaracoccus antarcticus]|uniref:Uncharacterized protein n=1 Tax=Tessaracoccus antarcticus TaxID=2479848 RepID=A0A3M0GBM0_9ACTN|nr:hypothetical protein [Tessaracoccus antarcticus]RMB62294.1 hypothetical protein EAX62_06980 [Tessaracoccus antarcticus]
MNDSPDTHPITDPATRRMAEVAATEFDGASGDGIARAVALGDLTVARIEVHDTTSAPGIVGQRLTEALNAALAAARVGSRATFLSIPGLDPALRAMLAGDADVEVGQGESPVDPTSLDRDFTGTDGEVHVTVAGRTHEVRSVHLPDLSGGTLALVPRAANRALAAAQTGQDGATPLEEKTDDVLAALDEKMSAIESQLDGVEDTLNALARDLGL